MQRKFLTNILLVLVLNFLVKPFYILGIDAEFLKRLEAANPGEYGEYFSLIGLTFIFNIFLDMGVTNYNTRSVAQDKGFIKSQLSSLLSFRILLVLGYFILLIVTGFFLGYSYHQFKLLWMLGFNQVLIAFILFFRSNLSGLLLFKEDSVVSVLDRFLLVIFCSLILWSGLFHVDLSIELFIGLQSASYFLTFLIALFLVNRRQRVQKLKINRNQIIDIVKKSAPYALLIFLMTIYYRVDSVMIERMMEDGKRQAALYAQGFRFFEAFTMVGYIFAGLLLPLFSRQLSEKTDVGKLLHLSLRMLLGIGVIIGSVCFFYSKELIEFRYESTGIDLENSAFAFSMFMVSFVAMLSTYVYGTLLTANGSLKYLNYMAVGGVVCNLFLNIFFINSMGIKGAALASAITQVLTSLLQIFLAYLVVDVKVDYTSIFRVVVFAITMILVLNYLNYWDWSVNCVVAMSSGGLLMLLTGLANPKEWIQILKEKD